MASVAFSQDFKRCEETLSTLTQLLKDRQKEVKQGMKTGGTDYKLKQNRVRLVDSFRKSEDSLNGLGEKEMQKQRKNLDKFYFKMAKVEKEVEAILGANEQAEPLTAGKGFSANESIASEDKPREQPVRNEGDGEFDQTRGQTNKQVLKQQRTMLQDQDQHLKRINNVVEDIKYTNQDFQQELDVQDKIMDRIDEQIDHNTAKVVKINNSMKRLIAKSNNCCLLITMVVLILVLVLELIFL